MLMVVERGKMQHKLHRAKSGAEKEKEWSEQGIHRRHGHGPTSFAPAHKAVNAGSLDREQVPSSAIIPFVSRSHCRPSYSPPELGEQLHRRHH